MNRGLVRAAREGAPDGVEIIELGLAMLPLYNQDVEDAGDPPSVVALKDVIRLADALLIATPEYNNGMSGVLKNAIDWASRPHGNNVLRNKPVAVIGASPSAGATARAQQQVREAMVFTGACVMPEPELLIGAALDKFDDHGNLTDGELRDRVVAVAAALHDWAERIRLPATAAA
jgi:chromate reductase